MSKKTPTRQKFAWLLAIGTFVGFLIVIAAVYLMEPEPPSAVVLAKEEPERKQVDITSAATGDHSSRAQTVEAVDSDKVSAPAGRDAVGEGSTESKDDFQVLQEWRVWAAEDPDAALTAARRLPDGPGRNEIFGAICFGLETVKPREAATLAVALHLQNQPGAIVESLVQQWSETDAAAALEWASGLPADDHRSLYLARIAFIQSQRDPVSAANLVIGQVPPGAIQDEAVMTVLHQWGTRDLPAAAKWAATFPTGPLRDRAQSELAGMAEIAAARAP